MNGSGRVRAFSVRNTREILRDPLSLVMGLGFPLLMLGVMTLIDKSIPPEAGMTLFRMERLAPGIAVFGHTFVMLFCALTVSRDRGTSFLTRLTATPMTGADFAAGYLLPMSILALAQSVMVGAAAMIVAAASGEPLSPAGMGLSLLTLIPSAVLFSALGLLIGSLFGEKSAPGVSSVLISLGSFLGGIWFDAEATGGVLFRLCRALPFWYAVKSARSAAVLKTGWEELGLPLLAVASCALLAVLAGALVFRRSMSRG